MASMLGVKSYRWSVSTDELGVDVGIFVGVYVGLDVGTLVGVDTGTWRGLSARVARLARRASRIQRNDVRCSK